MKIWKTVVDLVKDILYETTNFFYVNTRYLMRFLSLVAILLSFFCGLCAANGNEAIVTSNLTAAFVVPNLIAALVFAAILSFVKGLVKKLGKTDDTPVPVSRFTEVDEDGMVSVQNDRLQELLLYVSEVEDYLERKGKL